jgi:hypothetical protein
VYRDRRWFGVEAYVIFTILALMNVFNHLNYASIAAVVGWPLCFGSFACQSAWSSAKLVSETGRIAYESWYRDFFGDEKTQEKEKQGPEGKKREHKLEPEGQKVREGQWNNESKTCMNWCQETPEKKPKGDKKEQKMKQNHKRAQVQKEKQELDVSPKKSGLTTGLIRTLSKSRGIPMACTELGRSWLAVVALLMLSCPVAVALPATNTSPEGAPQGRQWEWQTPWSDVEAAVCSRESRCRAADCGNCGALPPDWFSAISSIHGPWYATCETFAKTLIQTFDAVKRGDDPFLNLAYLFALYFLAVLWDFVSKPTDCKRLQLTSHGRKRRQHKRKRKRIDKRKLFLWAVATGKLHRCSFSARVVGRKRVKRSKREQRRFRNFIWWIPKGYKHRGLPVSALIPPLVSHLGSSFPRAPSAPCSSCGGRAVVPPSRTVSLGSSLSVRPCVRCLGSSRTPLLTPVGLDAGSLDTWSRLNGPFPDIPSSRSRPWSGGPGDPCHSPYPPPRPVAFLGRRRIFFFPPTSHPTRLVFAWGS